MYLTVKQQVKHLSKEEYKTVKELCHIAKNLTNEASMLFSCQGNLFTIRLYHNDFEAAIIGVGQVFK